VNNYRSTKKTSHFTEEKEQETINCQVKKLQNYLCTVYLYSRGHDQLCTSCYTNCTFHQSYTNKCYAVVTQCSVSNHAIHGISAVLSTTKRHFQHIFNKW